MLMDLAAKAFGQRFESSGELFLKGHRLSGSAVSRRRDPNPSSK
jgi:hypothetical protein